MTPRAVAVLITLLAVLVAGFLALDGHDTRHHLAGRPAPQASPSSTPVAVSTRTDTNASNAKLPGSPSAANLPPHAAGQLLVIDSKSHPIDGALVSFLEYTESNAAQIDAETREHGDAIGLATRVGVRLVTDIHGMVELPTFERLAIVASQHGNERGIAIIELSRPPLTLNLHPASRLRVIVTDALSIPCPGIDVVVTLDYGAGSVPQAHAITQQDGLATFPDVATITPVDDSPFRGRKPRVEVTIAGPMHDRPAVEFDPRSIPAEPLRLTLPPCGRVRCEFPATDVEQIPHIRYVTLRARPSRPASAEGVSTVATDALKAPVINGIAEFPHVGLNMSLEAYALDSDSRASLAVIKGFEGPTCNSQEITVTFDHTARPLSVIGRIVDRLGMPVASLHLSGNLTSADETHTEADAVGPTSVTDDGGRFRLRFACSSQPGYGSKLRISRRVISGRDTWSVQQITVIEIAPVANGGDVDVGDILFSGSETLITGMAVDSSGMPLRGVVVRVMNDSGSRVSIRAPHHNIAASITSADGRFTITGDSAVNQICLGASLDGYYCASMRTFEKGTTNARIEMHRAGGIEGSFLGEITPFNPGIYVVVIGPTSSNGDTTIRAAMHGGIWVPVVNGNFSIQTLRPGSAQVLILNGLNDDDILMSIDDVPIVEGRLTSDPRLMNIPLAMMTLPLMVKVTDVDSNPITGASVSWTVKGSVGWRRGGTTRTDGFARLRLGGSQSMADNVTLLVTRDGYESIEVADFRDGATVRLKRVLQPQRYRVRLDSDSLQCARSHRLSARLEWLSPLDGATSESTPGDPRSVSNADVFGLDGIADLQIWNEGRYRVAIFVELGDDSGKAILRVPMRQQTLVIEISRRESVREVVASIDVDRLLEICAAGR